MAKATPTRGRPAPKKQRAKKPAAPAKKRTSKPKSPRTAFGLREDALASDAEAVALLLEAVVLALKSDEPVPEPARSVLLERLQAISPDPFGVPLFERPAQRPVARDTANEHWWLAVIIAELHREGMPIKAAKFRAAELFTSWPSRGAAAMRERRAADTAWRKHRAELAPKIRKTKPT